MATAADEAGLSSGGRSDDGAATTVGATVDDAAKTASPPIILVGLASSFGSCQVRPASSIAYLPGR
jgi:hypothetical protein